jgi:hypothetical protein
MPSALPKQIRIRLLILVTMRGETGAAEAWLKIGLGLGVER